MIHSNKRQMKGMSQLMHQCDQRKISWICVTFWLWLAFTFAGFSTVRGSEENLEDRSLVRLENFGAIQKETMSARLAYIKTEWAPGYLLFVYRAGAPPQPSSDFSSKGTDSALVGSVMALLATFEGANVLPPEGTFQANQLIHGLIQLQSVLVKSESTVLNDYISAAVSDRFKMDGEVLLQSIHQGGLTSKLLEALVIYDKKNGMWEQPALTQLFQRYNVSRLDWQLIEEVFSHADAAYRMKGSSIHEAYEQWRSQMPGGRS
jgi:hypothetical protein